MYFRTSFLVIQVAILIMAQVCLCVICAVLNYNWRETEVCNLELHVNGCSTTRKCSLHIRKATCTFKCYIQVVQISQHGDLNCLLLLCRVSDGTTWTLNHTLKGTKRMACFTRY